MTKENDYLKELRELHENHEGRPLEAALGFSIRSVQNYLNPGTGRVPDDKKKAKIREVFANWKNGKPLDYREQVELNLRESEIIYESRRMLEETLLNMSKDKDRTNDILDKLAEDKKESTAIIKDLVMLLKEKFNSDQSGKGVPMPPVTGNTVGLPGKQERLPLGKKGAQAGKSRNKDT